MDYFVLTATEDGDVYFEKFTKEEIDNRVSAGYYDDCLTELPSDFDIRRFSGHIIIKGDIVAPKPIEIIRGYTID